MAEVFATALVHRRRFDPARGSADAWLAGIARHKIADARRRGEVEARMCRRLGIRLPAVGAVELEFDGSAELLAALPADQRRAVQARVLEEKPYAEIAREESVSQQALRKRVSRALAALRSHFQEEPRPTPASSMRSSRSCGRPAVGGSGWRSPACRECRPARRRWWSRLRSARRSRFRCCRRIRDRPPGTRGAQGASRPGHTPTVANSGRSSTGPGRKVLAGDRIGRAAFGESPAAVARRLGALLGRPPSKPYHADHAGGGVDHAIQWPGLEVFFGRGRFVGYSYGQPKPAGGEPMLATSKGVRVGDTVATGERLYGPAFQISAEQGGAWFVNTPQGRLMGYTSEVTNPKGKILTIEAGHVGGPALTP